MVSPALTTLPLHIQFLFKNFNIESTLNNEGPQ